MLVISIVVIFGDTYYIATSFVKVCIFQKKNIYEISSS